MLRDQYGNEISTSSAEARDRYVAAIDLLLGGAPGMVDGFAAATEADPGFALGHCGLARARQIGGDIAGARATMAEARRRADGLPGKEASHLNALGLLIDGKGPEAYRAVRAHVDDHPRDVLVAQTCTSIYGLIGFSGQSGREAALLAYTATLLPHYGEDWWCLSQHAFSLCETSQTDQASEMVDRSLALNPRNAHAAHVRSHAFYEAGDADAGIAFLDDWLPDYDTKGPLYSHLSWHTALWALEQGDTERMWQTIDACVAPGAARSVPLIVLTDTASILYRAELAGETVSPERWRTISDYASKYFPITSIAFADVHAALAHAMAGENDALEAIIANPSGPAADLVRDFAEAYRAIAKQQWAEATVHLTKAMADHARIGGSRAQRDLVEFTLLGVLLKQGHRAEARRLLALRRPVLSRVEPVSGLTRDTTSCP